MVHLTENDRIFQDGHNSRGNQFKFKVGDTWYKLDNQGYEGYAETIVSNLLRHSNIENFVIYDEAEIEYFGNTYLGCKSENFKPDNVSLITMDKLFRSYYNCSVLEKCREKNTEDTILHFVSEVSKLTKIPTDDFGVYLTQMLELDAFTLNDDRHTNNIAVMRYRDSYFPAPIFDNGNAFLSDTIFYSNVDDVIEPLIDKAVAKPFSEDFMKQKMVCEALFGQQLIFDIRDLGQIFPESSIYPDDIQERVQIIFNEQLWKHYDLFKNPEKILSFDSDIRIQSGAEYQKNLER